MDELIKQVAPTKEAIEAMANHLISQALDDGEYNPLEFYIRMKALSKSLEIVLADSKLKSAVIDEAELYPRNERRAYGVEFEVRGTATKYDYSGSSEWVELNEQAEALKKKMKGIEAVLQHAYKSKMNLANANNGELISASVEKMGGMSIAITFK